jgi:hypothetical protein
MHEIRHIAMVVEDFEAVMEDPSATLGLTSASIQERELTNRYDGAIVDTPPCFNYSVDGHLRRNSPLRSSCRLAAPPGSGNGGI